MKRGRLAIRSALVAAGLLTAATLLVHLSRTRSAASGSTSPSRTVSDGGVAAGRQRRWEVRLETRLAQPNGSSLSTTSIVLTGDWVTTVSGASEAGYDVACQLERPHVSGDGFGDVDPGDVAALERRLSSRFWVTYQPDGAAIRAHFPHDMADDVRNLLQLVATQSQLVRPPQPSPQWTATERDGAGQYFAVYQQLGAGQILKRKMRYVALDRGASGASAPVVVDASEARFAVDDEGRIEQLDGEEATHVDPVMGAPSIRIGVRLSLSHPRSADARELIGSLDRARATLASEPIVGQHPTDEQAQMRQDARLLKGVTLAQLEATLQSKAGGVQEEAQLEALFRQRPAEIPEAVSFAREVGGSAAKGVLDAIGAAGTPAAQSALCALARDGTAPTPMRADAIVALVRTTRPTEATVSALMDLSNTEDARIRRQALYVAGAAVRASMQFHREQAVRTQAALLDRYARCTAPECVVVLEALGNLGTPEVLPSIEKALRDPDVQTRAAAARSLRLVTDPAADILLASTITDDHDATVRAAAIFAVTFRPIAAFVGALGRAARSDPVDFVRSDAVGVLAIHAGESPRIDQALSSAATDDPKDGIRRLAREALAANAASSAPVPGPSDPR